MAYCTKEDMEKLMASESLIAFTDVEGIDSLNEDVLDRAIADADAEINYWLGNRCVVPLPQVPAIVRKIATHITVYNLSVTGMGGATEDQKARYESAITMLRGVAVGDVSMNAIDPDGVLGGGGSVVGEMKSSTRLFTRDMMMGY